MNRRDSESQPQVTVETDRGEWRVNPNRTYNHHQNTPYDTLDLAFPKKFPFTAFVRSLRKINQTAGNVIIGLLLCFYVVTTTISAIRNYLPSSRRCPPPFALYTLLFLLWSRTSGILKTLTRVLLLKSAIKPI